MSCRLPPSATSIAWAATSTGGVAPVAFLWSNGNTSMSQTVSYAPGTYALNLQGTDASSTVATTTCSATVPAAVPTIVAFTALPTSIVAGNSTTLSWTVNNASTTSLNNGIGLVTGNSFVVAPTTTTSYTLTAVNQTGVNTSVLTVTVAATSTSPTINSQIQDLLNQIANLKAQIFKLLGGAIGMNGEHGDGTATSSDNGVSGNSCFGISHNWKHGKHGKNNQEWFAKHCIGGSSTSTLPVIKIKHHGEDSESASSSSATSTSSDSSENEGHSSDKGHKGHGKNNGDN